MGGVQAIFAAAPPEVAGLPFFEGGFTYNLLMFLLTVVGLILGVVALVFTLTQVRDTKTAANQAKTAAEAASEAAKSSAEQVLGFVDVVNSKRLLALCQAIVGHLHNDEFRMASDRCIELTEGLKRLQIGKRTSEVAKRAAWQYMLTSVTDVHDLALSANEENVPDVSGSVRLMREVYLKLVEVDEKLCERCGKNNANP